MRWFSGSYVNLPGCKWLWSSFWSLAGDKENMFEGMAYGKYIMNTPLRAWNWSKLKRFPWSMVTWCYLKRNPSIPPDYRLIYDFLSEDFVSVGFLAIFGFAKHYWSNSFALEKLPSCENALRPWTLSMLWNARDAPYLRALQAFCSRSDGFGNCVGTWNYMKSLRGVGKSSVLDGFRMF